MTRMKKTLLFVAVLAILGIVGSALQKTQPAASTPTIAGIPVTIASPLPVPVSGTVSAQQSGTWNVGISGTPSVNIANSPTVNVASSATAPFFFRNLDDPVRNAYESANYGLANTSSGQLWVFPVPANHRLVVQHLSGHVVYQLPLSETTANVEAGVTTGGFGTSFNVPIPSGSNTIAFDESVRFYVDGGPNLNFNVSIGITNVNAVSGVSGITATSYLLDCSAAPCAAIAQ